MRVRCGVFGWVGRRTLGAEELARDVELLAADNNNLLAVQELLGDSGGQATEKVALAVDDNLCISISHRCSSPFSIYPPGRAGVAQKRFVIGECVPQARRSTFCCS